MTNSTTHNRSVILCLGGWGVQVGLHLLPRLRFSQEQRLARGISGPDLTRGAYPCRAMKSMCFTSGSMP